MDTKNYMDTNNQAEPTKLQPDQVTMREYDGLVGLTMLNIYSLSKELGVIRLVNFDKKNKEHLFILRIALIAREMYGMPVEVEGNWWDIFCLNWKIRKGFNRIKRAHWANLSGIWVPDLLNFMRPDGKQRLGESFTFADIYNAYYEGSLD